MSQIGNFVKDDVSYTLAPFDDAHSYGQLSQEPAGDDVIIGGDLYRVTAVDSQLKFTFDTTGEPEMRKPAGSILWSRPVG